MVSLLLFMGNSHYLMTKICKFKNEIYPDIMKDIFTFQENGNYNLRSGIHLASRNIRTTLPGTETVSNLGPNIWPMLPDELIFARRTSSLQVFKNKKMETNKLSN